MANAQKFIQYGNYIKGIIKSKYVGINHYRRIFAFKNNIPDLDEIYKFSKVLGFQFQLRL